MQANSASIVSVPSYPKGMDIVQSFWLGAAKALKLLLAEKLRFHPELLSQM